MAARGRKCTYTNAAAEEICRRLAEGESLRHICEDEHMPLAVTVRSWVVNDFHGFAERYARARDLGLDQLADEIIDIANTPAIGVRTETTDDKVKTVEADMIEHRRLQVDARKWYLSKLAPRRYGDMTKVEFEDVTPLADRLSRARKRAEQS